MLQARGRGYARLGLLGPAGMDLCSAPALVQKKGAAVRTEPPTLEEIAPELSS